MFDRYTEYARRVLFFARYELGQLGGSTIENDHILLGLLRQPRDTVSRILEQWNVPVADLRVQLEAHARHGDRIATSVEVPFSASTKRVLNLAAHEADRLVHMDIECAHLILGLLHEKESFAATALAKYGLSLEGVRAYVASAVGEDESRRSPTPGAAHSFAVTHIHRITVLVGELATAERHTDESRALVDQIHDELMMLQESL